MVSTVIVMVSILVGNDKIHVSYDYDGTMEDCIRTIQSRMSYDVIQGNPAIINKYFCVSIKEAHNDDEEA
ncbi:hypothetical protein CRP7_gp06 [Roseobacter phage CRP-7]|nr:hypothetical protein CRP7_gp06 [Roseobacter phage CRP-7]